MAGVPQTRTGVPRPHGECGFPAGPGLRYKGAVTRLRATSLFLWALAVPCVWAEPLVQDITPVPSQEQRVEAVAPQEVQVVESVTLVDGQAVEEAVPPSRSERAFKQAATVATGVLTTALGLAATAAMLIFI